MAWLKADSGRRAFSDLCADPSHNVFKSRPEMQDQIACALPGRRPPGCLPGARPAACPAPARLPARRRRFFFFAKERERPYNVSWCAATGLRRDRVAVVRYGALQKNP